MSKTFDAKGEEWVRARLASFNWEWKSAAQEWLGKQGVENQRRAAAAQADQTEIARSAKDAAWTSARAARTANILSGLALVGAAIAIGISIIGLLHH